MRTLTANEIARTAFKAIPKERWNSPYGYTHPHRDKNEMCPYCKNEDTDVVQDAAYIKPFKEFYGDKKFRVIHCHCCTAVFSFWMPNVGVEPPERSARTTG